MYRLMLIMVLFSPWCNASSCRNALHTALKMYAQRKPAVLDQKKLEQLSLQKLIYLRRKSELGTLNPHDAALLRSSSDTGLLNSEDKA